MLQRRAVKRTWTLVLPPIDAPLPTVKSCLTFDTSRRLRRDYTCTGSGQFFLFFFKSHSGLIGRSHRVFRAFSFICAVFGPNWKQAKGGVTVTQVRALLIKRFECVLWQRR